MNSTPIHLLSALRQYRHSDSPELLIGYDYTEVNKMHKFLLARIAELELSRKELIEEFAEAECMGDLAKIARGHGYEEQGE